MTTDTDTDTPALTVSKHRECHTCEQAVDFLRRYHGLFDWAQGWLDSGRWAGVQLDHALRVEYEEMRTEIESLRTQLAEARAGSGSSSAYDLLRDVIIATGVCDNVMDFEHGAFAEDNPTLHAGIHQLTCALREWRDDKERLVERVAEAIYDADRQHHPEGMHRPWVQHGNSFRQEDARYAARKALNAARTTKPTGE